MNKVLLFTLTITTFSWSQTKKKNDIKENSFKRVLAHYQEKKQTEKWKAASFLIENISIHKSENYKWVDSLENEVGFSELSYPDLGVALEAFSILKDSIKIHPKTYTVYDRETLTDSLLIGNIDLAFDAWKNNSWSKYYDFSTFCEYILPYRSLSEPLEDWRDEYKFLTKHSVYDLQDKTDPVEVATKVILGLKDYRFLSSRPDPIPILSPKQLLFRRAGACPDLANLSLLACRSLGLAVTFDFTPHYGASSNRHYWNTIIDKEGNHIPFNGNSYGTTDGLPYAYYPGKEKRLAKVYRKTFSIQKQSLANQLDRNNIPDTFLRDKNIKDVTQEYVETGTIFLGAKDKSITRVAYLNVYNVGSWREVDWAKEANKKYIFKKLGKDLVYLPSFYLKGKKYYHSYPILLDENGKTKILKPNYKETFSFVFDKKNSKLLPFFREHNSISIQDKESYKLFVWDKKWKEIDIGKAIGKQVLLNNVPKNGLFFLSSENNNGYERIFTIDSKTHQINWY